MWQPNRIKITHDAFGNCSAQNWMYVGLQDIPSITSTTDTTSTTGKIFIELECHLELSTVLNTFTHEERTKPYHEAIMYADSRPTNSLFQRGQGFISGKPYFQDEV
jgi:hypothetical protein